MRSKLLLIIPLVFLAMGVFFFSQSVRQYQVKTQSKADETVRIDFNSSSSHDDKVMLEMGVQLDDIANTTAVLMIRNTFAGTPTFIQMKNPSPEVVNHDNFATLEQSGFFWLFSADSYASLTAIAQAYYAKYPTKKSAF